MSPLLHALSAESLKLRGTLALWMCLIAPATVAGLLVLQIALSDPSKNLPETPALAWLGYSSAVMQLWAFLMMPLFITLQSALLAGLEHGNQQWKHLLALPVPKSVHYLAKQAALIGMLALAMSVLFALIPLGGWLLGVLQPTLDLSGPPPWRHMARSFSACFAAGMLITALHTWASIRWRNFTVAVALGMTATVIGFLAMQSQRYGHYYPWSMPAHAVANGTRHIQFVVTAGLIGGLLVVLAGLWDFLRRDDA